MWLPPLQMRGGASTCEKRHEAHKMPVGVCPSSASRRAVADTVSSCSVYTPQLLSNDPTISPGSTWCIETVPWSGATARLRCGVDDQDPGVEEAHTWWYGTRIRTQLKSAPPIRPTVNNLGTRSTSIEAARLSLSTCRSPKR